MNRRTFILATLATALPIPLAAKIIDPKLAKIANLAICYNKSPDWEIIGYIHDTVIKKAMRDLTYGFMDVPKNTVLFFYKGI